MTQKIKFKGGIIATCMAVLIAMYMTVIISGCTSTELVDAPQSSGTKGQTITLNISCPEAAQTRADNDHVLRYSALLYEGEQIGKSSYRERKEILESNNSTENKIVFEVEENIYSIVIIGDYLPNETISTTSEGHYTDKYYDTMYDYERLSMRSIKDFPNNESIDFNCINNENYDCFAKIITVNKGPEEVKEDVTLERIVSRISFINTTTTDLEINDISVKNIDFFNYYNFSGSYPSVMSSHAGSTNSPLIVPNIKPISTNVGEELFYFYTLADNSDHGGLYQLEFEINFKDGSSYTTSISSSKIKPYANYKILVKGPFLAKPTPKLGPIILNLSTVDREHWETDEVNL